MISTRPIFHATPLPAATPAFAGEPPDSTRFQSAIDVDFRNTSVAGGAAVAPFNPGTGSSPWTDRSSQAAMPKPADVNPRNFQVIRVLYDDGAVRVETDCSGFAATFSGGGFHEFVKQEAIVPPAVSERVRVAWTIDHTAGKSTEALIDRHKDTEWTKSFDVVLYNMSFSHVVDKEWIERLANDAEQVAGVKAVRNLLHPPGAPTPGVTSSRVMRPCCPVPGTLARSTPSSRARRVPSESTNARCTRSWT